jgi:hypothetical protein
MLFFAYFSLALLLSLRSLLFLWKGTRKFLASLSALFFLILALPFSFKILNDLTNDILIKIALFGLFTILIAYPIKQRLRRNSLEISSFSWSKIIFNVSFCILGIILAGINAIDNLSSEKPILNVIITGKSITREMEWKPVHGNLQKSAIPCHELILQTPNKEKIFQEFLCGELCAIRAKVFLFPTWLNMLGISNRYCLDLVYSSYRNPEKITRSPIEAYPIPNSLSFFNTLLFRYWENFFSLKTNHFWIKTASLESNYFPLVDENSHAIEGEFVLSITHSGLTSSNL